jgi:hypothetical protein
MVRPRPGWLVTSCAAVVAASCWLPWLTTRANGGGHASAIGGTFGSILLPHRFDAGQLIVLLASTLIVAGAMTARELSARVASVTALGISVLIGVLTMWYYHLNVRPPVAAGYGLYLGAAGAAGALLFSVWAVVSAWAAPRAVARAEQ